MSKRVNNLLKPLAFAVVYFAVLIVLFNTGNTDLLQTFLTLSLMIPIFYLVNDHNKQKQQIAFLQQETLKSELNLLKSQINPHFFFNTLNNLYGLAVDKSDLTQEVIYKLSEMMRFTIYDGRKNAVSVQSEVKYLENFIELHQIRYQHRADIRFDKSIEDEQQTIPPLLFINLLENAFKHGIQTQTQNDYIHFSLKTSKTGIAFDIENNFDPEVVAKNNKNRAPGIGIDNLKRRLELLFPNKHRFTQHTSDNVYKSSVIIDLT